MQDFGLKFTGGGTHISRTIMLAELETLLGRLSEADLHVLNYSQLRMVGENLAPVSWLAIILDEGQYIKNPSSQTAQVARALRALSFSPSLEKRTIGGALPTALKKL